MLNGLMFEKDLFFLILKLGVIGDLESKFIFSFNFIFAPKYVLNGSVLLSVRVRAPRFLVHSDHLKHLQLFSFCA